MKSSKPWLYAGVRALDDVAESLLRRDRRPPPAWPDRILVSNVGHTGDALLTVGVPGALRRVFPGCRVDVLVSAEGADLFAGHRDVGDVHVVEPLLLSRRPPMAALMRAFTAARRARAAMAAAQYDLALELRSYLPNSLSTLARVRPQFIAGFGTAGFRFLLDLEVPHVDGEHELDRFARVIRSVGGRAAAELHGAALRPDIRHILDRPGRGPEPNGRYAVLHPGTRRRKRWHGDAWRAAALALDAREMRVVVTGSGAERSWLEALFRGTPARVVAGETDLPGLARLCAGGRVFLGVDSFPSHLAAAAGARRVVVVWHPFADPAEWAPSGNGRVRLLPPDAGVPDVLAAAGEGA